MVLGAWAGGRLFHGLASERLYRNVALAILFATGLFGLLRELAARLISSAGRATPWRIACVCLAAASLPPASSLSRSACRPPRRPTTS